jgi:hypothetical protein
MWPRDGDDGTRLYSPEQLIGGLDIEAVRYNPGTCQASWWGQRTARAPSSPWGTSEWAGVRLFVTAVRDRPAGTSAVRAISDLLVELAEAGHPNPT